MKLKREKNYWTVTSNEEVGYLWTRYGALRLYGTKLEMLQDQLKLAHIHRDGYSVRNSRGKREAEVRVIELEESVREERAIILY